MKFEPHVELKNRLIESLKKKYGKDRIGVHVSDLIYCLREVYFRRNNPQPITETELMFFVDGAERHRIIQGLAGYEAEKKVEFEGVVGSVDMIANMADRCPHCGKPLNTHNVDNVHHVNKEIS